MFRKVFLPVLLSAMIIACCQTADALEIVDLFYSQDELGRGALSDEDGGMLVIFVRNDTAVAREITSVTLEGSNLDDLVESGALGYWRRWPLSIEPGDIGHVQFFADAAPLNAESSVTVQVETDDGLTAEAATTLTTPRLRLGSLIPSQDYRTLYLYLRNLDSASYTINHIYLDEDVTGDCTFVGGNTEVDAHSIGIVKIARAEPVKVLEHFAVRVEATREGGETVWTGAPVRILEPRCMIGTWSSSMLNDTESKEEGRQYFHAMNGNTQTGAPPGPLLDNAYAEYDIRGFSQVNYVPPGEEQKRPNETIIMQQVGNPAVWQWMVRDEPAINDKPSSRMSAHNDIYWRLDSTHPTSINLADDDSMTEYCNITDIAMEDHYAHNAPLTGPGGLSNTILWAERLKWRTEPHIMWVWSQTGADPFGSGKPPVFSVNCQFWGNIIAGSKGIAWFKYGPGYEDDEDYEANMAESRRLGLQFGQVENLVLYGESIDHVSVDHEDAQARALVGENAMVLGVINCNDRATIDWWSLSLEWHLDPVSTTVSVDVPEWIDIGHVYECTPEGNQPASPLVDGRTLTFPDLPLSGDLSDGGWSRIFVIGAPDTLHPDPPSGLNLAQEKEDSFVLSWRRPFDNFGVAGYRLYRNGQLLQTTSGPLARIDEDLVPEDYYYVQAFDSAGAVSPPGARLSLGSPQWRFNVAGDTEGWGMYHELESVEVAKGLWRLNVTGSDPFVHSPEIRVDSASKPYVVVQMRNGTEATTAELFWITGQDTAWEGVVKRTAISISAADPDLRTYVFDLSDHSGWKDTITRIRLDPAVGQTGPVEIDSIYITGIRPSTEPVPGFQVY